MASASPDFPSTSLSVSFQPFLLILPLIPNLSILEYARTLSWSSALPTLTYSYIHPSKCWQHTNLDLLFRPLPRTPDLYIQRPICHFFLGIHYTPQVQHIKTWTPNQPYSCIMHSLPHFRPQQLHELSVAQKSAVKLSSKFGCFMVSAQLTPDEPHFKRSAVTRGYWLPHRTVQAQTETPEVFLAASFSVTLQFTRTVCLQNITQTNHSSPFPLS